MKYYLSIIFPILIALVLLIGACAAPAPAAPTSPAPSATPAPSSQPIVLKAIGAFPKNSGSVNSIGMIGDRVKERSKGMLSFNWIGGPEAIAAADQQAAVRDGVVDFVLAPTSYYEKLLPPVLVSCLAECTSPEERAKGVFDYWVKLYETFGVRYLGLTESPGQYYMFINKEIKNPKEDFKGVKIRSGAIYNPFIKALGASSVNVNAEEVYGAVQTGIVDGCAWVPVNFVSNKTYEVTKYWIEHGFYRVTTCSVLNLKKWNSLPKDMQDLLATVSKEVEAEQYVTQRDQEKGHLKKIADAGMKPITFSAADANWFVRLAYDSKWEEAKTKLTPQDYESSRKLLMK